MTEQNQTPATATAVPVLTLDATSMAQDKATLDQAVDAIEKAGTNAAPAAAAKAVEATLGDMDTSMLTSSEDDIQDVIREINKGFATCNFVGVIQRIEMKVEESSNRVVNILREIQKYYHDYGYDLSPETNLFSSAKEQLVKEEAITLLRTFIKEIHAYRYDSIRLYDSLELRFRIVENGNDTGFIEKIANVGSEGTDILVKAMINIMLLNVFKEGASRKFKDFKLHCMMDEIGKLHPNNISGILKFANDRNIILINGSPTELNRDAYKHVYLLTKGTQNKTRIARLISDKQL